MKILIINNNTRHIKPLSNALVGHELEIIKYQPAAEFNYRGKDLVILSGGGGEGREVHDRLSGGDLWYKDELEFILECPKPLLGICMGFELIAHAYGSKVKTLNKGLEGFETFRTTTNSQITQYESHYYAVQRISQKQFKIMADSDSGIEIIRHRQRPVIATQFHPELGGTLSVNHLIGQLA